MNYTEPIKNYIEDITETLRYVVTSYKEGKTDLNSAKTYFWCVVDAYNSFREYYTMPDDVQALFVEFGKALGFDDWEINEKIQSFKA